MDTKVPSTAITSINGMRVLSMWWVMLGHTYSVQTMWTIPVSKYSLIVCKSQLSTGWTTELILKTAKDMRLLFLTSLCSRCFQKAHHSEYIQSEWNCWWVQKKEHWEEVRPFLPTPSRISLTLLLLNFLLTPSMLLRSPVSSLTCSISQPGKGKEAAGTQANSYLRFFHFFVGNGLLAYDIIHRFTFQTVDNATFSVDSFFFLRCVLNCVSICVYTSYAMPSPSILNSYSTSTCLIWVGYSHVIHQVEYPTSHLYFLDMHTSLFSME